MRGRVIALAERWQRAAQDRSATAHGERRRALASDFEQSRPVPSPSLVATAPEPADGPAGQAAAAMVGTVAEMEARLLPTLLAAAVRRVDSRLCDLLG